MHLITTGSADIQKTTYEYIQYHNRELKKTCEYLLKTVVNYQQNRKFIFGYKMGIKRMKEHAQLPLLSTQNSDFSTKILYSRTQWTTIYWKYFCLNKYFWFKQDIYRIRHIFMLCIMTFRSTPDCIYNGGSIIL